MTTSISAAASAANRKGAPAPAAPRRVLRAVAVLLVAGAALYQGLLAGGHSGAGATRLRASSHLRAGNSRGKGLLSLPAAAQGPISQALGADDPSYRVRPASGGFAASTPGQGLRSRFEQSGIWVSSGATRVGLSLRGLGYGSSIGGLQQVTPRARANRVIYARPGLSERYVNGPLGLEQSFTITTAPSARARGPLTLSMALLGNARASLAGGGQSVTLGRVGRSSLRYSGLSATDARGHALHSWLELKAGSLLLRVDTRGARYPLRIDPFVQQGEKLTGGGEKGEQGQFGFSVALSPEGNTALIGGPNDNGKVGAAWVFTRQAEKWTQQGAKLTGKEESGRAEFGTSVALSTEGTTTYAVIGGPNDNESLGAAWVFTRSGSTWTQQGPKLTAKSGEETGAGEFGSSVAIASTKGEYALIGAPADSTKIGAAWVFLRSNTTWTQQGPKLTAKSGEETGAGEFGDSVALSGETESNTYALIGAQADNSNIGAAWVFLRSGTTWSQQGAKLTGSGETGKGEFGAGVAIASTKGEYALIGAPADNTHIGAAWVFLRSGATWSQQGAKLTGSGETGEGEFGASVALSAEGNTALMGGFKDNKEIGAAWVFTRSLTTWSQQGAKLTGSGEIGEGEPTGQGQFGYGVALSPEGNTALIGGSIDNSHMGAAWVFTRSGETWTQQGAKLTGEEESATAEFGKSVALSAEGTTTYAVIGGPGDNGKVGAAWVFTRSGSTWTQQGPKLTAKSGEETGAGEFGASVAIASTKGENALIGAPTDNANIGAAWVFLRSGTTWSQQGAKLTGSDETGAGQFGRGVALSPDGTYALMGAPQDKEGTGAASVFLHSGTTWTQQGAKLTAKSNEESAAGEFGRSVALSGETESNTYALIGAPGDGTNIGAAWVFLRSGTTWSQQGKKLTGSGETGKGEFGSSVAIASSKGEYALIGAPADNTNIGAAWVFLRSGATWSQQGAKLTGIAETGAAEFGASVALSSEGTTALTGGSKDNKEIGAAWVFTRSLTTWTQQGEKLLGSGEVGGPLCLCGKGYFGYSVALSSDGNTALIGGQNTLNKGAAWVFSRSGSTWTQQGMPLSGSGETGAAEFGKSVALSSDGKTALIGGPHDNANIGAAWVFTRSGETWTQQGEKLTGSGETGAGELGSSVALSSEGNTALIGAPNDGSFRTGGAWVFTRSGEKWTQQGEKLVAGEVSAEAFLGSSAALSADGSTALLGAPNNKAGAGAAWVFTRASEKWTQQSGELVGSGAINPSHFGVSGALSSDGSTALIGGSKDNAGIGAAWAFTRSGTTWSQQGAKLTGTGETGEGEFGYGVALSSEATIAVIGGPNDTDGVGAAWVFTRSGSTWSQQGTKLGGSGETGAGRFGFAVALSAEGNTGLVGGYADNSNVGGAWVFVNTAPIAVTQAASSITNTSATLNATVNPDGGNVSECKLEYGTTTSYGSHANCTPSPGSGTSPVAVSAAVELSPETTYHFRISATNAGGTSTGQDQSFKTALPNAPTVKTEPPTSITQTSATLNATVNPNGGTVTECIFEYGGTIVYIFTVPCTPSPGSGNSPVAVSGTITGLEPSTTWHYRIKAVNAGGFSLGADESLKTLPNVPPTVATTAATSVTRTLATLNGTVNPNGGTVSDCHFEYGPTISYGSSAPCASLPRSGETGAVAVAAPQGNLSPASTYHFRVSATSAGGTSTGSDQTFTTLTALPTPHWYKNGVKVALGEKSPLIGWGTLTLESSADTATCHTAEAANAENTAGAARKEVVLFAAFECKPVAGGCTGGEQRATPRHLPWQGTVLEEGLEGSGEFREEGWGIALNLECFKGGVNTANQLFKTGPVLAEVGTSTPAWLDGTTSTKPSEASFDASSGNLYAEVEKAAVKGTTKGKLKFLGYQDNASVPVITISKP